MVIVAAVDDSAQAQAVLSEADTLAQSFGETVHVLHVMKRSEAVQAEQTSISEEADALSVGELRERAASVAVELLQSNQTTADAEAVGRIGDPAAEIVSYADEVDARYVVVSPRQRSQTGKLLFGSVAQSVLLNASCPVVSLQAQDLD